MSLRAVEQNFNEATTPIASYDSTKINLGTLMIQKTGPNPEDNFVGPFPAAIARPMEESTAVAVMHPRVITYSSTIDWVFTIENTSALAKRIFLYEYNKVLGTYNWKGYITANCGANANSTCKGFCALRYLHTTGTVAVAAPVSFYSAGTSVALATTGVVTGVGTTFTIGMVGKMIGFGSTNVAQINRWYPIVAFTSTTSITVSGASNAIAASANYVIADCTVTGVGTGFVSELIAAGTNVTGAVGGLGPRIGFGSTDPTQITQWFQIGAIASDTSINLVNSPGVIAAGTPYVIEELRFAVSMINNTGANGGLFLVKGVGYYDFQTSSTAGPLVVPFIASNVDNQRGVYWLCDNGAGAVTNQASNGCAVETEISKTSHFLYVLDGTNTSNAKFYKYNLRANNTVVAGKMQLAGANIVATGIQAVTGVIPSLSAQNTNCELATMLHGPGSGSPYLYFVTSTRLYCALASGITAGSTTFITAADARQEIPPGGVLTFPATGNMNSVYYMASIDRLIITTYTGGSTFRQYVTRYPSTNLVPFDHIWGIDDKQQDQSTASSQSVVHFNTNSVFSLSLGVGSNGVVHCCKLGTLPTSNQIYALPLGAHWTYAYTTSPANHQRIITPSIDTTGCIKFDQLLILDEEHMGASGELKLSPEPFRVYYRTANIVVDSTSSWTLLGDDADLSGVPAANAIQFMFEFFTIGTNCIPARILKIVVLYEDNSTDSHYQLSTTLSNITSEIFAWRFCNRFGKTVPNLKVELFNAFTGASIMTDTTALSANGTWQKSIDGGSSWISYNTDDKINDITYIRYTPTSLTDGIMVKAVLTQN